MLQPLGISAAAEAVYVALGSWNAASADDLAQGTGLPSGAVTAALEELRGLGLASASAYDVWAAMPLRDVVDQLRNQRLAELERSVVAAGTLGDRMLASGSSQAGEVATLVGRDVVVAAFDEVVDSARRELLSFDKPPYAELRPDVSEAALRLTPEWRALDRGVDLRCVYHPGFDPARLQEMARFISHGERARTAPVPMKLAVVDQHVAVVPLPRSYEPGQELRMAIIRNPLVVEALRFLFEAVWSSATPILRTFTGEPDVRRRMLVSMLMTGATDAAIAKSLDINVRSVGRWVAGLMDEHGAQTRLQLGAALVRTQQTRPGQPAG